MLKMHQSGSASVVVKERCLDAKYASEWLGARCGEGCNAWKLKMHRNGPPPGVVRERCCLDAKTGVAQQGRWGEGPLLGCKKCIGVARRPGW